MQGNNVRGGFLSAFSSLAISAVAVKVLGAIYRIPLANILGTEGLGLYQMIFPIYSLLLILSSSALPSAISKLIAEERLKGDEKGEQRVMKSAKLLLLLVGGLGTFGLFFLSGTIARFQGIPEGEILYKIISPCVFIVACIALFRGLNQGRLNMKVTAYSQIIEQGIKMLFGLILTIIFRSDTILAVSMAVLSVTVSELFALLYVAIKGKGKQDIVMLERKDRTGEYLKRLLRQALPMTIAFSIYPIVALFESRIILQSIAMGADRVGIYGLFSGCVQTIVAIPISVINALAVALIPAISARKEKKGVISSSLKITLMISLPFFFAMLFLSEPIARTLYFRFNEGNINVLSSMLKYSSLTMLLYSFDIYFSGVLNGLGKPLLPMVTQGISGGLRLAILFFAVDKFGIYGAIFASWAGYFVATIINMIYIIWKRSLAIEMRGVMATTVYAVLCFLGIYVFSINLGSIFSLIISVIWTLACIALGVFKLGIFGKEELGSIFERRIRNEN